MHAKALEEYKLTRKELLEVQNCITTWMDMFLKVVAAVAAAAAFAYKLLEDEPSFEPVDVALAALGLGFLILTFSTIVFHKCNTHNRYAGFARAMVRERIVGGRGLADIEELHLWESVLEPPPPDEPRACVETPPATGNGTMRAPGPWERRAQEVARRGGHGEGEDRVAMAGLGRAVDACEARCARPLSGWPATAVACFVGFCMLVRGAIYRYETRSWTYVAQVGFGPFAFSTACALIVAMTLYRDTRFGFGWPIDWKLTLAYAALAYLTAAWIGIFYRVFRLCAAEGDRTIEHYANRFIILRALALQRRRVEAVYLRWP